MKKWWFRVILWISFIESGVFFYLQLMNLQELAGLKPVYSSFTIITLAFLALVMGGIVILSIFDLRDPSFRNKLTGIVKQEPFYWGVLIFFSLIFIESGQNLLFFRADILDIFYPFFLSENDIFFQWSFIISLQIIISLVIFWLRHRKSDDCIKIELKWKIGSGLILLIMIILILSGTGFISRSANVVNHGGTFGTTNAPLPMVQVFFIWLMLTAVWLLQKRFLPQWKFTKSEFVKSSLIIIIIWAAAFMIWSRVPISPNYFVDEAKQPTEQHTPISDSIFYETQAHRLLNGEGFFEKIQHPLYGYFLSGLHLVGGEHYEDIYILQIAILAIIPVLIYKLTSLMLSPFAGLLTSFLFIAREQNALMIGDSITITNVQQIMTEMIAQLGVVLVVYLMISWIRSPENSRKGYPALIGSMIGLLALMRVELLSLAIVFVLVGLFLDWGRWKKWLFSSFIMSTAVLLLTVPWMTRNWQVTGNFYLDKRNFLLREIQTYSTLFSDPDLASIPDPVTDMVDTEQVSLSKVQKIYFHTKSSLSQSILYLPTNHIPLGGIENYLKVNLANKKISFEKGAIFSDSYLTAYIKTLPYWKMNWDGSLVPRTLLPMSLVLLVMFQGFLMVWERNRLVALTPLLVLMGHILTYSLFSRSGGRFIQVVDWITLLYFSFGLTWLSQIIGHSIMLKTDENIFLGQGSAPEGSGVKGRNYKGNYRGIIIGTVLVVLLGVSMPIVEALLPEKYSAQNLILRLESVNPKILDQEDFRILDNGGSGWLFGKVIYPVFFQAGKEVLDDRSGRIPDSNVSRMDFYLIGMENIWVSIPLEETPVEFPHGAEVIILGEIVRDSDAYLEEGLRPYLRADKILLLGDGTEDFLVIEASGLAGESWE